MFRQSVQPVYTTAVLDALLAALSARPAAALWATPNVHLFTNNFAFVPGTVIGDVTEATYAGYAAIALPALSSPVNLTDGSRALLGTTNFVGGSIVAPGEMVYGYYITDTTNAILYAGETFNEAVPFLNNGDFLDLTIILPEPAIRSSF